MLSVNAAVPFFLLDVPSYKYIMLSLNFCLDTMVLLSCWGVLTGPHNACFIPAQPRTWLGEPPRQVRPWPD